MSSSEDSAAEEEEAGGSADCCLAREGRVVLVVGVAVEDLAAAAVFLGGMVAGRGGRSRRCRWETNGATFERSSVAKVT